MRGLTKRCREFLAQYIIDYQRHNSAAQAAKAYVDSLLGDFEHVTLARAKTVDSLRAKLRKKRYPNPTTQLTDLVGVRVVSYYEDDVDRITKTIKLACEIDHRNSDDKRGSLKPQAFGYRSVHLIARVRRGVELTPQYAAVGGKWFEIQVRSILEHAWAEIDHEVRYKSGVVYPVDVERRFAAIAGALEILDHEFLALRSVRNSLIETYRDRYRRGEEGRRHFDVARMLGFLEAVQPEGLSWRAAAADRRPFAARIEASCLDALRAVRLDQADPLRNALESRQVRAALRSLAASQGLAIGTLSHLSLVVAVVIVSAPGLVKLHFPEMIHDPTVDALVRRLTRG
jgi:ppGpp synthetase/RelA/SpoT-type nucleotidyltranferase